MFVYTTCRDCGGLLQVTGSEEETVHIGCTPRPTKYEALLEELGTLPLCCETDRIDALANELRDIECAPPRLAEAALAYASWGWPVFPLLPLSRAVEIAERDGLPLNKTAKRPATKHGFLDATTDADEIAAWWNRHPDSNVAVATGHLFDVIDIDPRSGGMESYRRMIEREDPKTGIGPIPDVHGKVGTASGGWHLYIKPMGGKNHAGNPRSPLPGIDFRGMGGYAVVPPSWLGDHQRWQWIVKPSPEIRR